MVIEECFLEQPDCRFSRKTRKQVFQTSEDLAAQIITVPFRPSEGEFSDHNTSDRVQTSFR